MAEKVSLEPDGVPQKHVGGAQGATPTHQLQPIPQPTNEERGNKVRNTQQLAHFEAKAQNRKKESPIFGSNQNTHTLHTLCIFKIFRVTKQKREESERKFSGRNNGNTASHGCSQGKSGIREGLSSQEPDHHRQHGLHSRFLRSPPLRPRNCHASHSGRHAQVRF